MAHNRRYAPSKRRLLLITEFRQQICANLISPDVVYRLNRRLKSRDFFLRQMRHGHRLRKFFEDACLGSAAARDLLSHRLNSTFLNHRSVVAHLLPEYRTGDKGNCIIHAVPTGDILLHFAQTIGLRRIHRIFLTIDNALLACQTMPGREAYFAQLLAQYRKTDEIPFDYARKVVSTLVMAADGTGRLILKGDVAHVVTRCNTVAYRGQVLPMEDSTAQSVSAVVGEILQDGMKVIAVAQKEMGAADHITSDDEQNLTLVGYLAFFDAPQKTAKASIAALKRLKVTPKVLTGDQADVAVSICRRVGIPCGRVLTGAQLDELTDSALSAAVEEVHVFAELTPGQKVRLVSALEQNGHTVGFLGDGINDIPALCEANVGISVDTAVDAAKDAADVVLLQKDLGVLEEGILEGRKTFTNMLKYIKITASSNFGNILSIVCASALLPFLPMTSLQLLLLNLLYDALCIILPWDNVDEEETLSPRDWSGRTLGRFMLSFGPISSVFDIATFLFLYYVLCPALCGGVTYPHLTDPALRLHYVALFQTGWFLESMWTQVLILHFLRTRRIPFVQSRPSAPVMVTTLAGIVVFTGLTFTKGGSLFGLTRLPLWYFGFLLVIALAYMLLTTVVKTFYQKKHHQLI